MLRILKSTEFESRVINDEGTLLVGIVKVINRENGDTQVLRAFSESNQQIKAFILDSKAKPIIDHLFGDIGIPTYMLFNNGKLVDQLLGKVSQKELECFIEKYL